MKHSIKIILGIGTLFGVYLYSKNQTPKEFLNQIQNQYKLTKNNLRIFNRSLNETKQSWGKFKGQLPKVNKAINDSTKNLDETMFQIEPRVEEINKYFQKINRNN